MNKSLEQVKEFHLLMNQPVVDKPTEMPQDRQELRLKLIFEELAEYAEASGKVNFFRELCNNHCIYTKSIDNEVINLVEQLDALGDLQYVLNGTILENGFGEIFDKAFSEIHRSNMSKVDDNEEEVIITANKYLDDNIDTYQNRTKNGKFITYRSSDNKVLKSHKYSPANLKPFINK